VTKKESADGWTEIEAMCLVAGAKEAGPKAERRTEPLYVFFHAAFEWELAR
jgi:hypothetical protein